MDDPDKAAMLAAQTIYLSVNSKRVDRHYYFKFSQDGASTQPSKIVKGGLLFGDNNEVAGTNYDIGDSSRAAEAFGLIARKLKGGKANYAFTTSGKVNDQAVAGVDDGNNYYLYVANNLATDAALSITFGPSNSPWTVPPTNSPVLVNEVSQNRMAEVAAIPNYTGTSKVLTFKQPAQSLIQIVVPKTTLPITTSTYMATEDATVRAGTFSSTNYGNSDVMQAGFGATAGGSELRAALLSFSGVSTTNLHFAILTLRVRLGGSNTRNLFTVLGMPAAASAWTEAAVTWATAPHLKAVADATTVNEIKWNPIDWASPTPDIVGHITVPPRAANLEFKIDVTDYIKSIGSAPRFIIHRPFRRNPSGDNTGFNIAADVVINSLTEFESSESLAAAARPTLTIYRH
jgi:hypothetical protein